MGEVKFEEIEFLVELLSKYFLESFRSIVWEEGLDYYKFKCIYDKYYGKYLIVSVRYNIRIIGFKSFVVFFVVFFESFFEIVI